MACSSCGEEDETICDDCGKAICHGCSYECEECGVTLCPDCMNEDGGDTYCDDCFEE